MTDQEKIIYDILCSDEQPPEGQHWEGFVASKIVAALAQPEQEPVAYLYKNIEDYEKHVGFECNDAFIVGWNMARTTERMLSNYFYTAPPQRKCCCGDSSELGVVHRADAPCFHYEQREWVGLTDEELAPIYAEYKSPRNIYLAIESALREKNT